MAKNIKCTQCEYLRKAGVFSPTEGGSLSHWCEADTSIDLYEPVITHTRDCRFFRSRTKTAWQEIKEDIFQTIPKAIKTVINYFVKNK